MPRIPYIDPAASTGEARELFEGPLKGKHFNIFKSMANSPAVLNMYLKMNEALAGTSLDDREKEVIQLAVGQANSCDYCLAAHTAIGKGTGLSEAQTIEARKGAVSGDAKLSALATFAGTLAEKKGNVSDEDIASFKSAGYSDAAVAEAVASYALAVFTNTFNHVNQTDVDFPAAPAL